MGQGVEAQKRRVDALWHDIESRYGLLTGDELFRLTGRRAEALEASGVLFVTRDGVHRYPGFQFTGGDVRPSWGELVGPLLRAQWTPEEVLLWLAAPTGWLDGRCPVDALDDSVDAVRDAVNQAALGSGA